MIWVFLWCQVEVHLEGQAGAWEELGENWVHHLAWSLGQLDVT
jgi:hypothetical protein